MKCPIRKLATLALAGAASLVTSVAPAQTVIYSDDFETDTSANYSVRAIDQGNAADYNVFFATNYNATTFPRFGVNTTIPVAPSGAGGRGVKMFVNKNDANAQIAAINIYPNISQPFTNDYALKVDMFLGYNGPAAGGTGSTEFGMFGINHTGTQTNWNAPGVSVSDGAWFAITGEGGAAQDYRSFVGDGAGFEQRFTLESGGFFDRDTDGTAEEELFYTSDLPTLPFWLMFPTNTVGETPGVPGKQWVKVEVRQRTNSDAGGYLTTWLMNNYVIARHTNVTLIAGVTNAGTVMLGNMDNFASIASPAIDNYVIYDNLSVVDLQGAPDLPEVSITTTTDTAQEPTTGEATFTLTRKGSTASPLTVTYVIRGTAVNGTDYTNKLGGALSGTITFAAGDASTNLTAIVRDDTVGEPTETIILSLNTGSNYEVYDSWSKASILDDGDVPTATVSTFRIAAYEGNADSYGVFRVILSQAAPGDVTVNYSMSGTAVGGTHYTALSGSTTIFAGSTTNELTIVPIQNADTVSNRTAIITLTTGTGYSLGAPATGTGTVTIFNDDLAAATGTLYTENFDVDNSANWNINISTNNCDAAFGFDYATALGIPAAPHSPGGSTLGLRLRANTPAVGPAVLLAQFPGITVSPKLQNFTGDYRLRFDMWLNFIGPLGVGATGSTELGTAGITRGTICQFSGFATSSPDAVFFGMITDAQNANDYRVYTNIVRVANGTPGVYGAGTAGTGDNAEAYYSVFGRVAAPAGQSGVYLQQSGTTAIGAFGMAWRDVVITKLGNTVIHTVDGVRMGVVNAAKYGINLSTNIFVGFNDVNGTQHTIANDPLQCAIYDNLVVESLPAPTQPGITNIVITGGNVQIDFTNSVSDFVDLFTVRTATSVTGPYTYQPATITELAPGAFRAVTPYTASSQRYYRILR